MPNPFFPKPNPDDTEDKKMFPLPEPQTPAEYLIYCEHYKDSEIIDVKKIQPPPFPPSNKEAYRYVLVKMILDKLASSDSGTGGDDVGGGL